MLVDASSALSYPMAVALSAGSLVGAVLVYDALCRTPVAQNMRVFGVVGVVLIMATAWGLLQVFSARAVFLQVGAMLGTVMASNVFFRIIPGQKLMLAATAAGEPVDASRGALAKMRSTHNHYLTLPVLFLMLSNHFPTLYGHDLAWLLLGLMCVAGVGIKYVMNVRTRTHPVVVIGTLAAVLAGVSLTVPRARAATESAAGAAVSYAQVETILAARCTSCHAKAPTNPAFGAAPVGVLLDSPAEVVAHRDRILARAVHTKTMPLGNLTGMTDDEREVLGRWIAQGASTR